MLPSSISLPAARLLVAGALLGLLTAEPARAQVETFINKPGSDAGPSTKVVPTNCATAADGTVTCDTKHETPPGNTCSKPHFSPFKK
ncbi:MAG: hypothetical protein ACKO50_03735 [Cyanobium sp.]